MRNVASEYRRVRHFPGMVEFRNGMVIAGEAERRPALFCRLRRPLRGVFLFVVLVFSLFVPPGAPQSQGAEEPEANPGRPTLSTPATLTPADYLQFETGFLGASHSPELFSRYSLHEGTKFSVGSRLELLASGEPIAHYTRSGTSAEGQRRNHPQEKKTW